MKYKDFIDLKYKPKSSDLLVLFRITPAKGFTIKDAASRVASESSNGTWTDLKVPKHILKLSAKCYSIKKDYVKIAYPNDVFEKGNMSQVLSSIAGNVFGMKAVNGLRLESIQWPKSIVKSFKGPKYGINGVRKIMKVKKRPLVATVPKPKVGYYSSEHAKIGYEAWMGGVDLIKDDENLSSQSFNKFEKRLKLCMKYRDKAEKETGERKSYLLNVTAETKEMLRRAKLAKDYGNEYAMIDVCTTGWAAVHTLVNECKDLKLAVHAHRAFHAAFDRNPYHGMSMKTLVQTFRLLGVDQLHIGGLGKLVGDKTEVYQNWANAAMKKTLESKNMFKQDWYGLKPVLSTCSGGLHAGIVSRLMDLVGTDIVLQAGGGIHGHVKGTRCGAKAFRDAIDAYVDGVSLKSKVKESVELKQSLDAWGVKTFE